MKYAILSFSLLTIIGCGSNETKETASNNKQVDGKKIYMQTCSACHQTSGKGMTGTFPPLAGSDYLLEDKERAIKQVLHGSSEKMVVNGVEYTGMMPPQNLNDEETAAVLNYVLHAWGNSGDSVTVEEVKALR